MPSSKLRTKQKPKQAPSEPTSLSFSAIGTSWHIMLEQQPGRAVLTELSRTIEQRIEVFDQAYSRFRADSLVSSMAQRAGDYSLPGDAQPLFDLYEQLYKLSDGRMTPLIGGLLSDAGYDAEYSLQPGSLRSTPSWSDTLVYDFPRLHLKQPALIDLGAAGKGYLVDLVAEIIIKAGIASFSINAGGDIRNHHVSAGLNTIGLEHPLQFDQVLGVARLQNGSLCGSAGNRRAWATFNHIIDPVTKQSPDHLLATWVVADSTLLADGLATALYFVQPSLLRNHYDFEYALVRQDLSLEHSAHFPAQFFTETHSEIGRK